MAPVGKWCDNCRTTTHDFSKFWGPCFGCGAFGHKAVHCKNPKSDHPVSGGAVKKAGDGEASKLSEAAKKSQSLNWNWRLEAVVCSLDSKLELETGRCRLRLGSVGSLD